ncbi:MAG TPA: metallophosphoesterase [Kofleriaceae bacterium]
MTTSVYVVSDLHLGGAPGFRMCSEQGVKRLAALFEHISRQAGQGSRIELVIAGDIVDFLAVEDSGGGGTWSAFTNKHQDALDKLEEILESTAPVWDGLAACARRGCIVTLMLGNHDLELSFPRLRRRLIEKLGGGPIMFLYDNEAYTNGKLLVEHGNRYDSWNTVDHDGLRRVRSLLSRNQAAAEFATQPGSELVVRVMNKIKRDYAWVDLLKPETGAAIPILAVLATGLWRKAGPAIVEAARAAWRDRVFRADRMPRDDSGYVAELDPEAPVAEPAFPDEDVLAWVEQNVPRDADGSIGALADIEERLLFAAMRKWGEKDSRTFAIENEDERYLDAASTLARGGYSVVIFGHTHLVKRIALQDAPGATYLNTGTWADLIRVPESTLTGEQDAARTEFHEFFQDLEQNRIERIRRLIPTFARVDLDDRGEVVQEGVYFFDEGGAITEVTTAGVLAHLKAAP